jgi:hypothetical protein
MAERGLYDLKQEFPQAKAIAVASSYGDGADRTYLDSPKAEWLWEFAETNDIVVHIHPLMLSVGHEVLMQYRLNEAVGRPFDLTVNGSPDGPIRYRSGYQRLESSLAGPLFTDLGVVLERDPIPITYER